MIAAITGPAIADIEFHAGQMFEAEDGTVCAILSLWQGYVFHHWFFAGHWFGGGGYSERAFRATLISRKARLVESPTVITA